MFAPLAYTIAIALAISLVISLTLSPALASYMLKGGAEHDTWLIRTIKTPVPAAARLGARKREDGGRRRGRALRRDARGVPVPRHRVHSGVEGGLDLARHGPRAEYLARRVDRAGDGGDAARARGARSEGRGVADRPRREPGRPGRPERGRPDRQPEAALRMAGRVDAGRHRRGDPREAEGHPRRAARDGAADLRPRRRDGHRRAGRYRGEDLRRRSRER